MAYDQFENFRQPDEISMLMDIRMSILMDYI